MASNIVARALIDALVGARGTVNTNHAECAVCNVCAMSVLTALEPVLTMMSTESFVVVKLNIIGITLDNSSFFNFSV